MHIGPKVDEPVGLLLVRLQSDGRAEGRHGLIEPVQPHQGHAPVAVHLRLGGLQDQGRGQHLLSLRPALGLQQQGAQVGQDRRLLRIRLGQGQGQTVQALGLRCPARLVSCNTVGQEDGRIDAGDAEAAGLPSRHSAARTSAITLSQSPMAGCRNRRAVGYQAVVSPRMCQR